MTLKGQEVYLFFKTPRQVLGPTQHTIQWAPLALSSEMFTHLHLVPSLRMNGEIPPLSLYAFVVRTATTLTLHVLSQDW
jgi:hypothetical protein